VASSRPAASSAPPQPANNQIVNGDFSSGSSSPWGITVNTTGTVGVSGSVTNGQYCVYVPGEAAVTIGWPSSGSPVAMLKSGTTYEFYYQASVSGGPLYSFEAKVGQAVSPYGLDYSTSADLASLGPSLQTFIHTFSLSIADSVAGIAFNIETYYMMPATVCIDNVALGTPN
jgi:endoglucanase